MATTKSQRIGIWIIAIVLTVGTIGSFFVMVLANKNAKIDLEAQQSIKEKYQKIAAEYQAKVDAQSKELSAKYYPILAQYKDQVNKFNAESVNTLGKVDLLVGDGAEIKKDSKYSAYYIGWNPDGKIFDQSIEDNKLKAPLPGQGLISGWTEGVVGMKMGGVRELTIPADKAYGDKGQGDLIPPHTPLKFIVLVIPTPAEIPLSTTSLN